MAVAVVGAIGTVSFAVVFGVVGVWLFGVSCEVGSSVFLPRLRFLSTILVYRYRENRVRVRVTVKITWKIEMREKEGFWVMV